MHILPHWNITDKAGDLVKVMIFTNCDEVELSLNERFIDRKPVDKYEMVTFWVPYEPGTLEATGYRNGKKIAWDKVVTAGEAVRVTWELSKECLLSDGLDAVAVNLSAVDSNGILVPNANFRLDLQASGGVEIIGVGNGDPNSHEPDIASYVKLFHGKGQVILRNTREGMGRLLISSEKLLQAEVIIPIKNVNRIPFLLPVKEKVISGWKIYYELFDTMPSLDIETKINDMNCFQDIVFNGKPQAVLDNQYGKYALYRTNLKFSSEQYAYMEIPLLYGTPWIYLDKELIFHERKGSTHKIIIPLNNVKDGMHRLDIIILNSNKGWPFAGICSPVLLKEKMEDNYENE